MATPHGKETKTFIDGNDLTQYFQGATPDETVDLAEIPTFGKSAKVYVPGLRDGRLSLEGVFDAAANAVDAVLGPLFANVDPSLWTVLPEGDALGKRSLCLEAFESSYGVQARMDDAVKITAEAQSRVGIERGVSLGTLSQKSGSGNGSSHNNGAATTTGGAAYLHATGATALTTVKVQDSADNVTFADVAGGTFTAFSARTKERLAISGTIRQYSRESWNAGVGNATFHVSLARNP